PSPCDESRPGAGVPALMKLHYGAQLRRQRAGDVDYRADRSLELKRPAVIGGQVLDRAGVGSGRNRDRSQLARLQQRVAVAGDPGDRVGHVVVHDGLVAVSDDRAVIGRGRVQRDRVATGGGRNLERDGVNNTSRRATGRSYDDAAAYFHGATRLLEA